MNITFVTSFLTIYGGAGNFLRDYANQLCENGHDITIVAQKIDRNNYQFDERILLIEVGGYLQSNPFHWIRFNKIKKKYLKILTQLNSDLFISSHFPLNYFCSQIKIRSNFRHINYCHEPFRYFHDKKFYSNTQFLLKILTFFLRLFFKKYDIKGTRNADMVICNSKFTKKKVRECYNRDSTVLYPILNLNEKNNMKNIFDFNQKFLFEQKNPILFTLGLTHHMKGAKELIHIFNKIIYECPETILLIGGQMTRKNKTIIKKLVKRLKIPNKNIHYIGPIERQYLGNFYNLATLTLFTALDEPFGIIPLESMELGTPVIAFEGAGPSETIKDGETGYLIKDYNINEFAQKSISLIKNNELRKKFSINAKNHVIKNFNFENSVSNLESILQDIIQKN